jgi:hypothetical protein
MMRLITFRFLLVVMVGAGLFATQAPALQAVTPEEAEAIAEEAYIYAYPMLENYKAMYMQAVDPSSGAFRAPFNHFASTSRPAGAESRDALTPNNDTLSDVAWLNLETEPLVLSVPTAAVDRYYAFQFVDMYTHNFAYVGARETGFGDGRYLIAGPYWSGKIPHGMARVLRSDGNFVLVIGRTQVNGNQDAESVNAIQTQYKLTPLSAFLRQTPEEGPAPNFPPFDPEKFESAAFIGYLNFFMGQMRQRTGEAEILKRFAKIGIGPNRLFEISELDPDIRLSIQNGVRAAINRIAAETHKLGKIKNAWRLPYGNFGAYEEMQGDYLVRAAAAMAGLYGNTHTEIFKPLSFEDGDGQPYDGSKHRYTIRFEKDAFPPVRAFWSLSLYKLPERRFVKNGLNRFAIGERTVGIQSDPDGALTIRIQHLSPGPDLESNWLPAPAGPFYLVLRLYWPDEVVNEGNWTPPPVKKLD